jgi:hypothetical protein
MFVCHASILSDRRRCRGMLVFCCLNLLGICLMDNPSAQAQLKDCQGISAGSEYKIAVDEVTSGLPTSHGVSSQIDIERLTSDIQVQVEKLAVEQGGEIVSVPCSGRRPRGELDFDRRLVEALNNNNVVLEIWGSYDQPGGPKSNAAPALLRFVLVPVRYYEHFLSHSSTLGGVYVVAYEPMSGSRPAIAVFEESSELRASVSLSMALKKIKEGHNELAIQYLCQTELSLRQPDSRIPQAQRDALLNYTHSLEDSALPRDNTKVASLLTPQAKASVCSRPSR